MNYLYLSFWQEWQALQGWCHEYLVTVLNTIPRSERPEILTRRHLLNLHTRVSFKRCVVHLRSSQWQLILQDLHLFSYIYSVEEAQWLRSLFYRKYGARATTSAQKQITWISRCCKNRFVVNEESVVDRLATLPARVVFVSFNHVDFYYQFAVLADSDILVTIHGAQLTNILFMMPDSVVIELFNPLLYVSHYHNFAVNCGLNHIAFWNTTIVSRGEEDMPKGWTPHLNHNIEVNATVLVERVRSFV